MENSIIIFLNFFEPFPKHIIIYLIFQCFNDILISSGNILNIDEKYFEHPDVGDFAPVSVDVVGDFDEVDGEEGRDTVFHQEGSVWNK